MNSVPVSVCRLRLSRELQNHEAPRLGGFFGRKFEDQVLKHNRGKEDDLLYPYPTIQFKVIQATAVLLGIGPGAERLQQLWAEVDPSKLHDARFDILGSNFETCDELVASTDQEVTYRFQTIPKASTRRLEN